MREEIKISELRYSHHVLGDEIVTENTCSNLPG